MTPAQVEHFLHRLNDAWLAQDYVGLSSLYHAEAVLLPPDVGEPITGLGAICDSYKDFHAACSVRNFAVTSHSSWAYGSSEVKTEAPTTIMVHMRFEIEYQLNEAADSVTEEGLEVYTLLLSSEHEPQIVWRAQFAL